MEHKKMVDYAYHYGLKVRIYPCQQQKEMIRRNADATRCVYNEHVAVNKEIARFGRRSTDGASTSTSSRSASRHCASESAR